MIKLDYKHDKNCIFGQADMKKGKLGEAIVSKFYELSGYKVTDLSDDPNYRKVDIDFLVEKDDYAWHVEVKFHNKINETNNVCLEHILDTRNNMPGWLWTTASEVLIAVNNKKLFIFETADLQDYMANHLEGIKGYPATKRTKTDTKDENTIFHGRTKIIYFINIDSIRKAGYQVDEYNLKITEDEFKWKIVK